MTTIAYRDGVIAADTGMSIGGSRAGRMSKIVRGPNGELAGAAGNATYCEAFRAWVRGGRSGPPPEAQETEDCLDRAMICRAGEPIEVFEPGGRFAFSAPYFAIGSGRPEALGTMHHGATAAEAIAAAMAHDEGTFGEVESLSHAR